jgi:hypothetical protein
MVNLKYPKAVTPVDSIPEMGWTIRDPQGKGVRK